MERSHQLLPRVSHHLLFFPFTDPVFSIHIQMFRIPSHEHALFFNGLGYLFFFVGFRLLFRVISDMLCTCISQAVAHTQSHIFHFTVSCCMFIHSSALSHKILMTMDPRSRSRWHCNKVKESKWAGYDPNTLPTLFFTTPVSICPPKPPIDQLEETMF
jgi:hypothetical protein